MIPNFIREYMLTFKSKHLGVLGPTIKVIEGPNFVPKDLEVGSPITGLL